MKFEKLCLCVAILGAAIAIHAETGPAPEVFAPGVISGPGGDGSPSFTPDGNTLFFTRSAARWSAILESHRVGDQWSKPTLASFSGEWPDSSPAVSADGSFIVFASTHRTGETGPNGQPKSASHLWRVDRQGAGWGTPHELPATVNFCPTIFRPSLATDGSLYFTAAEEGKELHLFRSLYRNGAYLKAEALTFSNGTVKDVDPEIAPDQSFVIFSSRRWPGDQEHEHLYIAYSRNGEWGGLTPLRYAGDDDQGSSDDNDPRLGTDHHTLYFSSDRSVHAHFPRNRTQAEQDVNRMETWDNGNTSVWTLPITPWMNPQANQQKN